MSCDELEKLRANIRQLQSQMKSLRQTNAAAASGDRREAARHHHVDSSELLKRRIARATVAIEHHVAAHRCNE